MNVDVKGFIGNHPAVLRAIDDLVDALAVATEDAVKAAIGAIPFIGGVAETVTAPLLDKAEAAVDAALKAKLAELLDVPLVVPGSGVAGVVEIEEVPSPTTPPPPHP